MQWKIMMVFVLVGFSIPTYGQQTTSAETGAVLLDRAVAVAISDPAKSMELATNALVKSQQEKNIITEYKTYLLLGQLHAQNGNNQRASELFKKASEGFRSRKMFKEKAEADRLLAQTLEASGEIKEAAKAQDAYLNSSVVNNDKKAKLKALSKSALLNSNNISKKEAGELIEKTIPVVSADTVARLELLNKLSGIYRANGDTERLQQLFFDNKGYLTNSNSGAAATYTWQFGDALLSDKKFGESIKLNTEILNSALQVNNFKVSQQAYFNLGKTYTLQHNYAPAISMYTASLQTAIKNRDAFAERESLLQISETHEKSGNLKDALEAYKRYTALTDSFKQLEVRAEVRKLGINEQFAFQEDRIRTLETAQNKREWELAKQRQILWWMGAVLLVISGMLFMLFRTLKQKQKANLQNRLQSLRNQMNPHFIFNSLNSVNHYISRKDERAANQYLSDFSKLMRGVLSNSSKDFITLREELDMLRVYVALEHARFSDRFSVEWEISEPLPMDDLMVPPLLFQPYVENAVWHGLRYLEEPGHLKISLTLNNDMLKCLIEDNGIGRKKSANLKTDNQKKHSGTGIRNTVERIEILNRLHHAGVKVSIQDLNPQTEHSGTKVEILIPVNVSESA